MIGAPLATSGNHHEQPRGTSTLQAACCIAAEWARHVVDLHPDGCQGCFKAALSRMLGRCVLRRQVCASRHVLVSFLKVRRHEYL